MQPVSTRMGGGGREVKVCYLHLMHQIQMKEEQQRIVEELLLVQREILTGYIQRHQSQLPNLLRQCPQFIDGLIEAEKNDFIITFAHNLVEIKMKNSALEKNNEDILNAHRLEIQQHQANLRQALLEKNRALTEMEELRRRDSFLQAKFGPDCVCVEARVQDLISNLKQAQVSNITKDAFITQKQTEIKSLMNKEAELSKFLAQSQHQLLCIYGEEQRLKQQNEELKKINNKLSQRNEQVSDQLRRVKEQMHRQQNLMHTKQRDMNEKREEMESLKNRLDGLAGQIGKLEKSLQYQGEENEYLRDTILNLKEFIPEIKQEKERIIEALENSEILIQEMEDKENHLGQKWDQQQQQWARKLEDGEAKYREIEARAAEERAVLEMQKKGYEEMIGGILRTIEQTELRCKELSVEINQLQQQQQGFVQANTLLQNRLTGTAAEAEELREQCEYHQEQNQQMSNQLKRTMHGREGEGQESRYRQTKPKHMFVFYGIVEGLKRLREENLEMRTAFQKNLQACIRLFGKEMVNILQRALLLKNSCSTCHSWSKYTAEKGKTENPESMPRLRAMDKSDQRRMKKAMHLLMEQNQQAGHRIQSLITQI